MKISYVSTARRQWAEKSRPRIFGKKIEPHHPEIRKEIPVRRKDASFRPVNAINV